MIHSRLSSRNLRCIATGLVFFVLIAAGASAQPADLTLETVITGLSDPIGMRHAGDGSGRLFVIERAGTIRIWTGTGTATLATPFLDITSDVLTGGERGLLGLAFHPNYENNGLFFVSYTGQTDGRTVIERFNVSAGNPNVADPSTRSVILEVAQPFSNHNGGDIHFGPDGYLYIGIGDGGDLVPAQDLEQLLGKMLRIDIDSPPEGGSGFELCGDTQNYTVPNNNPFVGAANACDEIWHFGLRNPWRWSFDRATGDLLIGDVGEGDAEEVNFQPAGSSGGENWGWACREGSADFLPQLCDGSEILLDPAIEYSHAGGQCSVIGGYVYRGSIPDMTGRYIYADWCTGEIWFAVETSPGVWSETLWQNLDDFSYVSFGEDEAGEVYVTQFGAVARFSSATSGAVFEDGFESGDTTAWSNTVP